MTNITRLPLNTTYNTRDLGGIPANKGSYVKWNKVLRSDDVSYLDEEDMAFLADRGIKIMIDLRTKNERETTGYTLDSQPEFKNYNISLMISDDVMDITKSDTEMTLGDFYCRLLDESKVMFKDIFNIFYAESSTGVLFHCAAGKDRTGVVAALLLNLLGVSDTDIIANYEVTYSHLSQNEALNVPESHKHLMNSDRDNIILFLEALKETYDDANNYLLACGMTEEQLNSIKEEYLASI